MPIKSGLQVDEKLTEFGVEAAASRVLGDTGNCASRRPAYKQDIPSDLVKLRMTGCSLSAFLVRAPGCRMVST